MKVWLISRKHYQLNEALQRDGEADITTEIVGSRKLAKAKVAAARVKLEAKTDEDGEAQDYAIEKAKDGLSFDAVENSALVEVEVTAEEKEVETDGEGKRYVLTTLTIYEQTDEKAVYSKTYPTRKQAEKAMRKQIKDDMDDYCEGADIIEGKEDYDKIIKNAIEAGGEEHDALIDWTADRVYIYDIFEDIGK